MTNRLVLSLALIVAAGCADKLTGPAAQSAAREYQSKSMTADKVPLIFVNGNEVTADSVRHMSADRIESVEVIKGRKALEPYGARGQNGVIFVVTKR